MSRKNNTAFEAAPRRANPGGIVGIVEGKVGTVAMASVLWDQKGKSRRMWEKVSNAECLDGRDSQTKFLHAQIIHVFVGEVLEELESTHVIRVCRSHGCHAGLASLLAVEVGDGHSGALVGTFLT